MSSESESDNGDGAPHPHHPEGTQPLYHIAVDYCPEACRYVPEACEIHVTYDDRGGARWRSRRRFLPGSAVAGTIRAPSGDTSGLNCNIYLSSLEGSTDQDEIDFEFLGHDKGAVQTNYHVDGEGGREQMHELPFDSSDEFHHYAIAWDDEAIEWRVDGEVIRREERREGEPWPTKPMFLYASVGDASHVDEGRWTGTYHGRDAPYVCSYRDVRVPMALSLDEEEEEEEEAEEEEEHGPKDEEDESRSADAGDVLVDEEEEEEEAQDADADDVLVEGEEIQDADAGDALVEEEES